MTKTKFFKGKTAIRLIATDLDGTLLDPAMGLPKENRETLERCADDGILIVVATGRSLSTVPEPVRKVKGLTHLICSNGSKIYDNASSKQLYAKYLSGEAIDHVSGIIRDATVMKEVFWQGTPYTDRATFENLTDYGVPEHFQQYVRKTRRPVDGIADFVFEHKTEIENINFIYGNKVQGIDLLQRLSNTELYTLTSSFPFNFEIGGAGVDKASALQVICDEFGIDASEVMAFGDSANDLAMLRFAGVSVAMQGASHEVREAADFVTLGPEDCGVALAINSALGYK